MQRGVSPPGAPPFGTRCELLLAECGTRSACHAPKHEIRRGEGVGFAEGAQRHILRRPRAEARKRGQPRGHIAGVPGEVDAAVAHGVRERTQCGGARPGDPEPLEICLRYRRGRRKEVSQALGSAVDPLSGPHDQPCTEGACRRHADLLPQHRPHGAFERIPHAGDTQSRAAVHERSKQRIRPERARDPRRVGRQIEDATRRGDEPEQFPRSGSLHAELQCVHAVERSNAHGGVARRQANGSRVPAHVDAFDAGNRARAEKLLHLAPVVGRPEREAQHHVPP